VDFKIFVAKRKVFSLDLFKKRRHQRAGFLATVVAGGFIEDLF
jgi:hypothetical protein